METTPVAFSSDYNPIEEQIYQHEQRKKNFTKDQKVPAKSSSSSDSLHPNHPQYHHQHHHMQNQQNNEFYKRPANYLHSQPSDDSQGKPQKTRKNPSMRKADSSASIMSESNSNPSENSLKKHQRSNHSRSGEKARDNNMNMSDSSLGDSLFSYTGEKRYFGSSESCRFGYECRRCSLETDKCFSDTCRHDLNNCDCSSSYFSSDFDETNPYPPRKDGRRKGGIHDQHFEHKTSRYADEFIKHVSNVKKRSQDLIYDAYAVPKDAQIYQEQETKSRHHKRDPDVLELLRNMKGSQSDQYASVYEALKIKQIYQDQKSQNQTIDDKEILEILKNVKEDSLQRKNAGKTTGTVPKLPSQTMMSSVSSNESRKSRKGKSSDNSGNELKLSKSVEHTLEKPKINQQEDARDVQANEAAKEAILSDGEKTRPEIWEGKVVCSF